MNTYTGARSRAHAESEREREREREGERERERERETAINAIKEESTTRNRKHLCFKLAVGSCQQPISKPGRAKCMSGPAT